ncbi:MAG: AAA family ATPase, partial [Gammaproteobacteria bacterium]|nr:AAA family ATPase [Gammaproteobacteria bacterium]
MHTASELALFERRKAEREAVKLTVAQAETDVPPLADRLAVPVSWEAIDVLCAFYDEHPPTTGIFHLGWDMRRLFGDEAEDEYSLWAMSHDGASRAEASLQWNSFTRDRVETDALLIDALDEAESQGAALPTAETTAIERLRHSAAARQAARKDAERKEDERDSAADGALLRWNTRQDHYWNLVAAGAIPAMPIQSQGVPLPSNVTPLPIGYDAKSSEVAGIAATPFRWVEPSSLPQREWLYGHFLIRRQVSLTVAHPGAGKSTLTIAEALAMATGRMLLHDAVHQPCKVWLWNGEDPIDELQRRIAGAALHHKIPPEWIEGRLFVDSGRRNPMVIAHTTREGTTVAKPVEDALTATIRANEIDVVVIDPFVSAHSVSENDNNAIDLVAKTYARIADVTGCAIHLVHHSRKTGGESVDAEHSRGASALLGAARAARTMNVMTADEAAKAGVENRFAHVRIDDGKANLAPRSDKASWIKLAGQYLKNGPMGDAGDSVGVATRWRWPDAMEGITPENLVAVQAAVAGGQWRENIQAKAWVGKPIAEALGLD